MRRRRRGAHTTVVELLDPTGRERGAHCGRDVERRLAIVGAALDARSEACDEARVQAVRAGADPESIEIVEVEEIPLAYLTNPASRIRVKAAGPLGAS